MAFHTVLQVCLLRWVVITYSIWPFFSLAYNSQNYGTQISIYILVPDLINIRVWPGVGEACGELKRLVPGIDLEEPVNLIS